MSSEQGGRTVREIRVELDYASNTSLEHRNIFQQRQSIDSRCFWGMVSVTSVATVVSFFVLVVTHPLPVQSTQHHNPSLNDISSHSVRRGPIDQGRK